MNFTFQIEALDRRRIKEIKILINKMPEKTDRPMTGRLYLSF